MKQILTALVAVALGITVMSSYGDTIDRERLFDRASDSTSGLCSECRKGLRCSNVRVPDQPYCPEICCGDWVNPVE